MPRRSGEAAEAGCNGSEDFTVLRVRALQKLPHPRQTLGESLMFLST
jgi:hypothetical protein